MTWPKVALLDALGDASRKGKKVPQSAYLPVGELPVVDQGQALIGGYTNDQTAEHSSPLPVIVFGDHTKAFKYIDFPFAMGADGVKVLSPRPGWDAKFLFHFLRSVHLPDVGYSRHFKFLREELVPLPPLDEQRRIAAILDQVERIGAARWAVVQKLDQLADAAFEASLGEGMLSGGCLRPLVSVLTGIGNGRSPKCESRPRGGGEWGVLKLGAVSFGRYQPAENKAYLGDVLATDKVVRPGDVLMVRKNTPELVGAVAHVRETPDKLLLPDLVFRLEYDQSKVVGEYLRYALMAPRQRAAIRSLASGSARSMSNISIAKLRTVQIPVPPMAAQFEFTRVVRGVEAQREAASQSLVRLQALRQDLQARAFSGGL